MIRYIGQGVLVALLALVLGGCNSASSDAPAVNAVHLEDWLIEHGSEAAEGVKGCKGCHTIDFSADSHSSVVACMSCHTDSPEDYPSGCNSCHGKPPVMGAHTEHNDLSSINNICSTCHEDGGSGSGAHFNWVTDVTMGAAYDAKTGGPAVYNMDGTCSGVSCHGGQDTPDNWALDGGNSINVETDCTLCHAYGTAQYNSYNSGRHYVHIIDGLISCTACHNPTELAVDHFSGLGTQEFEGDPGATISGSSISYYNPATNSCTTTCHGGNRPW